MRGGADNHSFNVTQNRIPIEFILAQFVVGFRKCAQVMGWIRRCTNSCNYKHTDMPRGCVIVEKNKTKQKTTDNVKAITINNANKQQFLRGK